MKRLSVMKATARRDDVRYPRHGMIRILRTILLFAWWVIGLYASAVGANIFGLLRQGLSHLADWDALLRAFLVFDFLANPKTPRFVLIPLVLAFGMLVAASLWALRDAAIERAVRRMRAEPGQPAQDAERSNADTPSLYLFSLEGGESPRRVPLLDDEVTIGRDTSNVIVLNDPRVSRKQLRLVKELYYWRVIRSEHAATLYINGQSQTNCILRPYDQIVVGTTVLSFTAPLPTSVTARLDLAPRLIVNTRSVNYAVALRDARITLGRAPDCGVVVPSVIVSRKQAELLRTSDSAYEIRNLSATNDLQFEGRPVSAHTFRNGDTITIGAGSDVEMVKVQYQAPDGSQTTTVDVAFEKVGLVTQILNAGEDDAPTA